MFASLIARSGRSPLLTVWHDTRLIVLVAQTAAVYAAILIPFKMGIPLIPGYSELRPANAIPIVASLLFGPVAAWGSGFGNLIGDCFGTLGIGSLFGFLGNFCYGYVPYLLWGRLGPLSSGGDPEPRSFRQTLELTVITLVAAVVCAVVVAWGVDLVGLLPFRILAPAIFLNDAVMGLLLAPPLLLFLHPRVKRWGLLYKDIVKGDGSWVMGKAATSPLITDCSSPITHHSSLITTDSPIVEARNVRFTFQGADRPALDGLSLAWRRGESVALMGRSGAGKSTLCYALNGLVPTLFGGEWTGQLLVHGFDTRDRPVWQQAGSVGVVFQDFEAQIVSTNVERELTFPLEYLPNRSLRSDIQSRIAAVLAQVGLDGLERRNPLSLSGGQRQRLVIASSLIREPALLALDEPCTDLDPVGRRALASLVKQLSAGGTSVIVADHDPEDIVEADRLCILDQGRLVWEGRPREFFGHAEHAVLAERYGIRPLPLADCFAGRGLPQLPLTVEEAWGLAAQEHLEVAAEPNCLATPPTGAPVIEIQQASYAYRHGTPVLSEVDLTIREGEFVALVGRNGCGKSTLASLMNGIHLPVSGRVLINGQDTRRIDAGRLAAQVGFVFQNPDHQIFAETVQEEVSFAPRNLGYAPEQCRQQVTAALHAVGLDAPLIRRQDPFSLTKGERQRVAVASVLAAQPRILIFDEPTTGLDARETDRMMAMIRRLNAEGHTIIMITHALGLVAAYAHRCVVLHDGGIALDGPTREVFALLDAERSASLGLAVPPVTRFAARWGVTLLTAAEVRAALRKQL
jgi:energy-coupling factor transporter ATP-binding protein EcfA2